LGARAGADGKGCLTQAGSKPHYPPTSLENGFWIGVISPRCLSTVHPVLHNITSFRPVINS